MSPSGHKPNLRLVKLSQVQGVNALCENQTIEFAPNLTIIYGTNGCGKSGYTRLLKKAFYSKAPEEIQPNIHLTAGHKPFSATFSFLDENCNYELEFPKQASNSEFLQFSVFDGKSVLKHLERKNSFEFRPSGLNYFSNYIHSLKQVEAKLNSDIARKESSNVFLDLFEGTSAIKTIIENISSKTEMSILKVHLPFSEGDKQQKQIIQKKYDESLIVSKNKQREIDKLENIQQHILRNKQTILDLNKFFTADVINEINTEINDCLHKEKLAENEGADNFASNHFNEVGSQEWKGLLQAARLFALKQSDKYPMVGDRCVLCQQALSLEAVALINNYWSFIKSVATNDAKAANTKLKQRIATYKKLTFEIFSDDSILSVWLFESYPSILEKMKTDVLKLKQLSEILVAALDTKTINNTAFSFQASVEEHDSIIVRIDDKLKGLNENEESREFSILDSELRFLLHKEKLNLHIDKIEKFLQDQKWIEKAKTVDWGQRNVTEAEKRLAAKYFNQKYVDAFNDECARLKGKFGIGISHTGAAGTSFRQLFIKGKNPALILSEGEQKIIAIADFVAEMKVSNHNSGIVFDDPVTSLDHERKEIIAQRLVEEAHTKQVIVFTHDITFLLSLKSQATEASLIHSSLSIFRNADLIGVTKPSLPWIASNVSDRNGYLKNELQRIEKIYRTSDPEQYRFEVKAWCGLLREAWERCVEERLFKGVVSRYSYGVETQKLKKVVITIDLINDINEGMTKCSKWVHDQAAGQNSPTPLPDELSILMNEFEDFHKNKCKPS